MSKEYQGAYGRFSSIPQKFGGSSWRQNKMFSSLSGGNNVSRFFLTDKGSGSGVHNRVVFERAYNRRALNLIRSSFQCGSILNAAQTGLGYTGDFYVMGYVKLTTNTDSFDFLDKWDGTGNQRSYITRISAATGQLEMYISANGSTVTSAIIPYTFPAANTKLHICFSYDASAGLFQAWVDGTSIGTQTGLATSIFDSTALVSVGALLTGGTQAFNGVIDHMKTGNSFLTTSEVLAKMDDDDLDGETAYWKFDGNALDESANNNDLSLTNSPSYTSPLFGSNIYLNGDCAIVWQGFLADQEEGSYGLCGADEEVAYGQIKFENNTVVIKTETDQTAADTIDISGVNVENTDTGLIQFILERSSNVWSLYLNGTVVGNTATVAGVLNIQQFLGSPEDTADLGYLGGMKNFKVYSAALSAGEKTTINAGGHVSNNCVYWANTDITSGTSVSDKSGNGRTGTLANAGTNFFFSHIGNNLFTYAGFNAWAGSFPNEVPTGWSESYSQSATNYLTEDVGKLRIVSDGTNLGVNKASVLVSGQRYKTAFYVENITSGNIYVFQETGNTSLLVNPFTVAVGWNVWEFTAGATLGLSYLRVSGPPADDVTIAYASLFKR